jgi:outer membrane lipoprotein-sorting protein
MKKFWGCAILTGFLLVTSGTAYGQQFTARQIVQKSDEKLRGESMKAEMNMSIVRPGWTRNISMKVWSKGNNYSMILITSPAKDKGQSYLKIKNEMWNWVPSINRMIKIPAGMMMQSWMGSDFTNDDLVRESSIVSDYTHKLLGRENVRGKDCYKIELTPLNEAAVVWGKIILWVTSDTWDQWKAEYYDEDSQLINTMNAYDIKKTGDRMLPTRIEIEPAGKKGQKTVLETVSMTFNIKLDDNFFSQQNMKKLE